MYNKEIPCDICNTDIRMDDFAVTFKGKPICTKCMRKIVNRYPNEGFYSTLGVRQHIINCIIEQIKEERKNVEELGKGGRE